jgi:hypothetical protein
MIGSKTKKKKCKVENTRRSVIWGNLSKFFSGGEILHPHSGEDERKGLYNKGIGL